MVSQIALGAIWGYQRYISPRKGWRCAHSVLHGGTGCSGFAKFAIRDHGLWSALPLVRARFRACREASHTLRANCAVHAQRNPEDGSGEDGRPYRGSRRGKRKKDGGWTAASDACDCGATGCLPALALPAFCASSAGPEAQPAPLPDKVPSGNPDANGCDLGGMECSVPSCDGCGSCDCAPSCG
ncbi:membrane protein insertion efficiency factor YidD [Gymnodinialimonas ulvae]|uniref:membrane protein insertion efficiency factor YidD n=1 Tax=Gymnodinialimonas ulvae TaxID=3126504 RepID=UPI0030A85507